MGQQAWGCCRAYMSTWLVKWGLLVTLLKAIEVLWGEGMDCEGTRSTKCRDRSITAKGSRGVVMKAKEDAWVY